MIGFTPTDKIAVLFKVLEQPLLLADRRYDQPERMRLYAPRQIRIVAPSWEPAIAVAPEPAGR